MAARWRVRLSVWSIAAGAVAVVAFSMGRLQQPPSRHELLTALLLTATIVAGRAFSVQLGARGQAAAESAAAFAAVLLLPHGLAVCVAALALGVAAIAQPRPFSRQALTVATGTLSVAVGSAVASAVLSLPANEQPDRALLPAILCIAAAMWLTHLLLVEAVRALQQERWPLTCWRELGPQELWQTASLYLIGLLVVLSPVDHVWVTGLLIVPSLVIYRSLRDAAALKFQTRLAVEELADIVDQRDRYTAAHCRRVAELSRRLAKRLGVNAAQTETIYLAARVHDVGKIGIKSTVLMKPGGLDDEEWREMRGHPEIGARMVARFPEFRAGRVLVLSHHERWDGSGYPRGLARENIPLGARIIAVADAWDAMTSSRAYREAMESGLAITRMVAGRGIQFDPRVLDCFLTMLREQPELACLHTAIKQDADVAERYAETAPDVGQRTRTGARPLHIPHVAPPGQRPGSH